MINLSEPVSAEDWQSLAPSQVTLNRISGWMAVWMVAAAAIVGLFALWLIRPFPTPWLWALSGLAVLLLVALAGWVQVWPAVDHRHCHYRATPAGLEIRRGVWWRSKISVPGSRIQHTDVRQGPLQRRLGLGTLVVFTAGTEYAAIELPGLSYEQALQVRDLLLTPRGEDATT